MIPLDMRDNANDPKLAVRHWHRYWIHWIGLVGLIFLLWGWFGFLRYSPTLSYGTRKAQYCLGIGDGQFGFVVNWHEFYTGLSGRDLGFEVIDESLEPDEETIVFPHAFVAFHKDQFNSSGVFIALWLLILIYVPIWFALISLWRRRMRRSLNPMNAPDSPL
jgi:hypothetical protein